MGALAGALPASGVAEQASEPASPAAGQLDAGKDHTCAILSGGNVRCWGYGGDGELGYPNTVTVGVTQTPASVGPVDLGPGRTATAISAGDYHTCAILDDGIVRCWGYGAEGRLGYGNTVTIGARQTPGSAGPVDLGGHRVTAISAGGAHTCAILDDASVRCWGFGFQGQLGYGSTSNVGDLQTPASVGPVDLGAGRTATAISAGDFHTCAILDDASVRCWGYGAAGRLGYGNAGNVGDKQTPGSVGPVNLGAGHTAVAISAGAFHTCAILDDGSVRCWGYGANGQLGYGNTNSVSDPASVGPVDLGPGRTAVAISAGGAHTCAILDDGSVRCWGDGANGELGYASTANVGDKQTPASAGPVNLGPGRKATAISAGAKHTCARLDDGHMRCWGYGGNGRLGYCSQSNVGDTQTPAAAGPVNLQPGDGGARCDAQNPLLARVLRAQARRARRLRACLSRAARRPSATRSRARQACVKRYRRTPGPITALRARPISKHKIVLTFDAPGSDGNRPPAARAYLVKQSRHAIRGKRDIAQAQNLCHGSCRFAIVQVDAKLTLTITNLLPDTTYYYVLAAHDNVTGTIGAYSQTVKVRTR